MPSAALRTVIEPQKRSPEVHVAILAPYAKYLASPEIATLFQNRKRNLVSHASEKTFLPYFSAELTFGSYAFCGGFYFKFRDFYTN